MKPTLNGSTLDAICTSFRDNLTDYNLTIIGFNFTWDNISSLCNNTNKICVISLSTYTDFLPIKATILWTISVLSIIGNLATIYSIMKNHRKRQCYTAIYTLILHLSVADLLVAIFCMAGEATWSYNRLWTLGNATCKIFKFMETFSLYLSTFVLVLIGIDRFVAVRYPMRGLNTAKKCPQSIVYIWILSFLFSVPQIAIFHDQNLQCATHGFFSAPWQEELYNGLVMLFMFFLPLVILIGTYVSTVIFISRSEKMFTSNLPENSTYHTNSNINRTRMIHRAKMKSLRISIVIVAAFVIWWTPYYIAMIIYFATRHQCVDMKIFIIIIFFGMTNSLVNPLIYGAFHLWPQKRKKHSNRRSDSTLQQRNNTRKLNNTETLLLQQDSNISNNHTISLRLSEH